MVPDRIGTLGKHGKHFPFPFNKEDVLRPPGHLHLKVSGEAGNPLRVV